MSPQPKARVTEPKEEKEEKATEGKGEKAFVNDEYERAKKQGHTGTQVDDGDYTFEAMLEAMNKSA